MDDSFGLLPYRKEFDNLNSLPLYTDDDGNQYFELTIGMGDLAGRQTTKTLRLDVPSTPTPIPIRALPSGVSQDQAAAGCWPITTSPVKRN